MSRIIEAAADVIDRNTSDIAWDILFCSVFNDANSLRNGGMVIKMAILYAIWKRSAGFGGIPRVTSSRSSRDLKKRHKSS
jgi:hypothetical protein